MAKLDAERRVGNDLGLDPSTPLFQVVRNWLGCDGNEIRLPSYPSRQVPPKAGRKLRAGKWHPPRTLQKPSISTPADTDPCFIGVFLTLNQGSTIGICLIRSGYSLWLNPRFGCKADLSES
jgi:hypothetical protein